jgi:hypothetical protein
MRTWQVLTSELDREVGGNYFAQRATHRLVASLSARVSQIFA